MTTQTTRDKFYQAIAAAESHAGTARVSDVGDWLRAMTYGIAALLEATETTTAPRPRDLDRIGGGAGQEVEA